MTDALTPDEIEEVTTELVVLLAAEGRLMEAVPISVRARERRNETLERLHNEIVRVARLLGEAPAPCIPIASRKAPA
jgi:uncharacterized protein (DUF2384 family)